MLIRAGRDDVTDPLKDVIHLRLLCPVLSFMVSCCKRPMQRGWEEKKTKFTFLLLQATKKLFSLKKPISVLIVVLFQQSSCEMGITAESYSSVIIWEFLGKLHSGDS